MRQSLDSYSHLDPGTSRGPSGSGTPLCRRFGLSFRAGILAFLLFGASQSCGAWVVQIDGGVDGNGDPLTDEANAVAYHPDGLVCAVGTLGGSMTALARVASSGAEVWTTVVLEESSTGTGIAIAPDGGVVVTGAGSFGIIAKLDPAQGSILWDHQLPPGSDVKDVTVDADGDVIAAVDLGDGSGAVVKLDGSSGLPLWQHLVVGDVEDFQALRVAVDSADDVLATTGGLFIVRKLDGLTGAALWTTAFGTGVGDAVREDSSGDVIAGGWISPNGEVGEFLVVKLAGSTGAEVWRYEKALPEIAAYPIEAVRLALSSQDDVFVAVESFGTKHSQNVARIDGVSGTEVWFESSWLDSALAVAVDENDNVYVGGGYSPAIRKFSLSGLVLWYEDVGPYRRVRSFVYHGGFLYVGGWVLSNPPYVGDDLSLQRLDAENPAGDPHPLPEFFGTLTPIWDNPLLWVLGFDSRREVLAKLRSLYPPDPIEPGVVLTSDPRDLVVRPDELVILLPRGAALEVLAVATVIVFGEEIFCGRTAPCVLLFENGGIGERWLQAAIKLGLWGPQG